LHSTYYVSTKKILYTTDCDMGDILIFEQYLSLILYYFYNRIFIPEIACFNFLLIYVNRFYDLKNQTQLGITKVTYLMILSAYCISGIWYSLYIGNSFDLNPIPECVQ
jgi:hypothetical protein